VGLVLGVSVFVAVLGAPRGYVAVQVGFRDAWWVLAGVALAATVAAVGMTPAANRS
jgi:hypothetical protein